MSERTEEWKPVVGFEGRYEVSSCGRVRNSKTEKILRSRLDTSGYPRHNFRVEGRTVSPTVHSLVAAAFIGPREGRTVNHLDSDKLNNRLENLEYVLHRENLEHHWERSCRRVNPELVREIRRSHPHDGTSALARRYGMRRDTVRKIARRKRALLVE